MDDSLTPLPAQPGGSHSPELVPEGFFGQRMRAIPRPRIASASNEPMLRHLLVTDAGFFPDATSHGRSRPDGASETVVLVCATGAGWVEIAGLPPARVSAGEAVVLPRGVGHRYGADGVEPWTIWWLHVVGAVADEFAAAVLPERRAPIIRLHDVFAVVDSIGEALSALDDDDSTASLTIASGAAWRALAHITASSARGSAPVHDRIDPVRQHLRTNLRATFSVPELAAMAGMSASHFSAMFRAATGASVTQYVKRLRSARARELLATTAMPIADVAASVGYPDALYFSRQFRAVNGVSPTRFRRSAAQEGTAPVRS